MPYWWDRKVSSLAVTLYNTRPDLFDIQPIGTAISQNPHDTTRSPTTTS